MVVVVVAVVVMLLHVACTSLEVHAERPTCQKCLPSSVLASGASRECPTCRDYLATRFPASGPRPNARGSGPGKWERCFRTTIIGKWESVIRGARLKYFRYLCVTYFSLLCVTYALLMRFPPATNNCILPPIIHACPQ